MITVEELNAEAERLSLHTLNGYLYVRFSENFLDDEFNELPPEQCNIVALIDGRKLTSADLRAIAEALDKLNESARATKL